MGVSTDITESKQVELRLQAESEYLKDEIEVEGRFADIVGQSVSLKKVFQQIEQVSPTDSIVLIMGETGTGKELVARAIHNLSRQRIVWPRKGGLHRRTHQATRTIRTGERIHSLPGRDR